MLETRTGTKSGLRTAMHTFVLTLTDAKYRFYDDPTTNLALKKSLIRLLREARLPFS
jgi:hypothetical protein